MSKADDLYQRTGSYLTESMAPRSASSAPGVAGGVTSQQMEGRRAQRNACLIEVSRIEPDPDQPRKRFDEESLEQLAHSLKTKGQLQPIRVRWVEGRGKYMVISGERRYQAAKRAGLATLECVVHEQPLSDDEKLELMLIENAIRENLNPIEQAKAYRELLDRRRWKPGDLATELKIHRTTIVKSLALLTLPEDLQGELAAGALPPAVGRELAKAGDVVAMRKMAAEYHAGSLTSNQAAQAVAKPKKGKAAAAQAAKKLTRSWPGGIKVMITMRKKEALPTLAQCLAEWSKLLLEQGRGQKDAA